jgi:hypothetical protein
MTGFAETGELDFDPEFDAKPVRGLRQWTLKSPDFRSDPLNADQGWPVVPLTGMTGYAWTDGVLEALCGNGYDHVPPVETLPDGRGRDGCGFWAYWSMTELAGNTFSGSGGLPVLGVIQGYGRVLLGELGFRCQRAKIIALAPSFSVQTEITPQWRSPSWPSGSVLPGVGELFVEMYKSEEEQEKEQKEVRERAQRHADAWMAMIQDRLAAMYPGVQVFATAAGLLASVPTEGKPA